MAADAMSGDQVGRSVRRPRVILRPRVPPGPLRELKELLYQLYLGAGAPTLDDVAAWVADDEELAGAPGRDTIRRCIGSPELPANQHDAVAVATVLARAAGWDQRDAAVRVRELWVQVILATPLGQPIAELTDPFALEVHPAVDAGVTAAGLPVLPTYIPREHDARLRDLAEQAAGGRSALAALVGGSSTGKTRACWEAVQRLPDGWRLWHPIDPGRPEAAAQDLKAIAPRTVVWLNDAQHYLLTPGSRLGEQVAAGLRELLRNPHRGPVLVLATLWPEFWAILTTRPPAGQPDPHSQTRELLSGADIDIPDTFTGPALQALKAAANSDPRLAAASAQAEDGQITQFLAGAPVVIARYRNAPTAAKALIEAAIDARQLGHSLSLPHRLLEAAVPAYLTDQEWNSLDDDWLEQALAYSAVPCHGARGPLTRIRPRPGSSVPTQPHYRLNDYLEQVGRASARAATAPATLWDAFLAHADRRDLPRIATEARKRGLLRRALELFLAAAEAGDQEALRPAARLLERAGRTDDAIAAYQRAAKAGDLTAMWEAARLLERAGRTDDAIEWLQARVEAGDRGAIWEVPRLLERAGRTDDAIAAYQRAAEAGDQEALRPAARLLERAGSERLVLSGEGILAVGSERMVAEAPVAQAAGNQQAKGTDNLVADTIETWSTRWLHHLIAKLERYGDDAEARYAGFWDALEEWFAREDFRGSFVANVAVELRNEPDHPGHAVVAKHQQAVRRMLEDLAHAAGALDPPSVAVTLIVLMDGAIALAAVDRRPDSARTARKLGLAALRSAM
jgi:hypothetical protein